MPDPSRPDRRLSPGEVAAREPEGTDGTPGKRSLLIRFAFLILLSAVATTLVSRPPRLLAVRYSAGDIAREDVKASVDFLAEDREATERRRRDAEAAYPAVYDFNPNAVSAALSSLSDALQEEPDRSLAIPGGVALPANVARLLASPEARRLLEASVRSHLEVPYARGVVANRGLLLSEGKGRILVRNLETREERILETPGQVEDFDEVRQKLEVSRPSPAIPALGRRTAAALLRPNLTYNEEETGLRKAAAGRAVVPVLYQIRRGEMLVREGDRVTADQARKLEAHALLSGEGRDWWQGWLGIFFPTILLLYSAYEFGRCHVKKFRAEPRDVAFLAATLVFWLLIGRLGNLIAAGIGALIPAVPRSAVLCAVPVGAAAMVVRVVLNSETALVFGLPFFALAALTYDEGMLAFFFLATGGLVGAHRAARACRRIDLLRAGLWMGLAQAGVALGLGFLDSGSSGVQGLWNAAGAAIGGGIAGFLALSVVPLAEATFGYTTDMRLMELASLDHPLLRSLMLRAPGTYHHSIVTGSLVKAAAESIGARALLASVAAYYHDIGKVSKPAYFIENQADGGNRHDKLAPSMSSLILLSHVKEGVELARKHRLGKDITDILRQHHGTCLIHYFYERACQRCRPNVDEVKESDYRYPGPKPRSREAGLVLLADAVEAASRTLPDPRPARIQGMVQNIINRMFSDGQLDECNLTLKDLHEIARSFSRILTGIHHQRIDYPLAAQKGKKANGDLDTERLRGPRDRRGEAPASGPEALKRLGL